MKFVKRLIGITLTASAITIMGITTVKAATVTVTSDTLNIREKASQSSKIIAVLSNGAKCDFIEEDGDWYKIKFGSYTGYISKQYSKKNEDTSSETKTDTTSKTDDSDKSDNTADTKKADDSVTTEEETTGKIANNTAVRIVPLIYSNQIGEVKKGETVTIISEQNNWAYIATSSITGWVRIDSITGKKIAQTTVASTESTTNENENSISENTVVENTVTTDTKTENTSSNTVENTTSSSSSTSSSYTEKTMYVNDYSVNVRKEASTSSKVMMVLGINTKLTVIGEEGDWYKVKTSEGNGYVSKKLLTSNSPTTSRGGNMLSDHKVSEFATSNDESSTSSKSISTGSSSTTSKQTEIVNYAKQFLGVPYVYGGASKSGFDCSGFTMYVYKKFGISMRHGAQAQAKLGTAVNANKKSASSLKENLQPGDLVFFLDYETMDEIGHCGIYIGDGKFIHASSGSGYCVKINSLLPGEYYNTRYCAARRVI